MLRSDLCDLSDAYIVVKETINLKADENDDMHQKDVNRNGPFRSCVKKLRTY